ncbi:hypothetical protein CDAR_94841 [Caerostris darwini]|uniref:Uncharacterized protein n=1 Tax=Caerostris darwini TaxID=1538125 RepID=A0AAV4PHQ9_9ARAC|nr:hypothetical protein CDAR_94841 [Caerostris darwini]
MQSLSLPQRYRHSHHPQLRHRKRGAWDLRSRGCGSMWASESALMALMAQFAMCGVNMQEDGASNPLAPNICINSHHPYCKTWDIKSSVTSYYKNVWNVWVSVA